jgi:hypothetical protein
MSMLITVVKNNTASVPATKAIKEKPVFLEQLKKVLEVAKYGQLASHKTKLVYTNDEGRKSYSTDLVLEGFKTYILEREDFIEFSASEDNWDLSIANAKKFLDKTQREEAGITGYTTTYKVLGPTSLEKAEEVT